MDKQPSHQEGMYADAARDARIKQDKLSKLQHAVKQMSAQLAAKDARIKELEEAVAQLLVQQPSLEASDGPCCSEFDEKSGFWLSTGCDCGKYDDAAYAQTWRDEMNAWVKQEPIRDLLKGNNPMANQELNSASRTLRCPEYFEALMSELEQNGASVSAEQLDSSLKEIARRSAQLQAQKEEQDG